MNRLYAPLRQIIADYSRQPVLSGLNNNTVMELIHKRRISDLLLHSPGFIDLLRADPTKILWDMFWTRPSKDIPLTWHVLDANLDLMKYVDRLGDGFVHVFVCASAAGQQILMNNDLSTLLLHVWIGGPDDNCGIITVTTATATTQANQRNAAQWIGCGLHIDNASLTELVEDNGRYVGTIHPEFNFEVPVDVLRSLNLELSLTPRI